MAESAATSAEGEREAHAVFPEVYPDDWCGEFAAKEGELVHAVLCLRTGHIDGWYSDRPQASMEQCLEFWKAKLGHSDLVIISRQPAGRAPIQLALNSLESKQ